MPFLLFPSAASVLASTPDGLAGRLETGLSSSGFSCEYSLQWYEFFGPRVLSPTDTLTLDMAVMPFDSGATFVGLDMEDGPTFFGVSFDGGTVDGLPYSSSEWNDVRIDIRPGSQDYLISVNGQEAGPFPLAEFCPGLGGCHSVQAFRLHSFGASAPARGWLDTLSLTLTPDGGSPETLYEATFDDCASYTVDPGAIIPSPPPGPGRTDCARPRGLMAEVGESLSSPAMRGTVRSSLMQKLRGALKTMDNADLKAARVLEALIPVLEAERGGSIPAAEADALIAKAKEALAAISTP